MTQLAPQPKFQAFNIDGTPMVGGKLYTYGAGTSTPKDSYTTYTLAASNTNPIILDARGEASVWMFGSYRFVLRDANDVIVWDVDDVRDVTNSSTLTGVTLVGTLTVSSSAVTWAGNPTHSGNHTFTNNVVFNGNVTIGDSSVDTLTIRPNAVTWGTTTTHSGAHAFSSTVDVSGILTANTLSSTAVQGGTYTPTITGVANVAAYTLYGAMYSRAQNVVTVSGYIQIDPTSATTTSLGISLPVGSALAFGYDVIGVANCDTAGENSAVIGADTTNDRAQMDFTAVSIAAQNWRFVFQYIVK